MYAAIYVHVVSVQYIPMFLMLLSSTICIFYCFYEKINYYRFPLYAAFVFLRYVFYLSMLFGLVSAGWYQGTGYYLLEAAFEVHFEGSFYCEVFACCCWQDGFRQERNH
jgi:hypothetical protein